MEKNDKKYFNFNFNKKNKNHYSTISMTFLVAGIVFVNFILINAIIYFVFKFILKLDIGFSFFNDVQNSSASKILIILVMILSLIIAYGLMWLLSKIFMIPIKKLTNAMEELSLGNYKKRLDFKIPFPLFQEISSSFNKMASEFEHTEILNNDFINNFSHEFKTPISSILGFAKLLKNKKDDLSQEEISEYLDIIEEESFRLIKMSTSILNLMKVENQNFLTNIQRFNLSEQIRNCILLLQDKWDQKNLNMEIDFDEYFIFANKEMLKEVWINLIDNAIKYTPNSQNVKFEIKTQDKKIFVAITNFGVEISSEHQKRIFNKFYQVDKSHSSQGFGIGLAIVKRIVDLHCGEVFVLSENLKTTFVVSLPFEI